MVEVTSLSVHIGAEIGGVDLSGPLSDAGVGAIHDALLTWKVVFFRGQHLTAHLAPVDIFDTDFDRQFYRVTLMGDVPVGPDGLPSTIVEGKPIEPAR